MVNEESAFDADKTSRIGNQEFDRQRYQRQVKEANAGTSAPGRISGTSATSIKGPQFTSIDDSMPYGPRVAKTLPKAPPRI